METSYEQYKVDSHRHNAYEYIQIYTSDIILAQNKTGSQRFI